VSTHAWWITDGVIWSLNFWLMGREKLDRWGSRIGWWLAHWQLDRMHQQQRLAELQMNVVLLRAGDAGHQHGPAWYCYSYGCGGRRRMSEGGYDW
jgi:hypothetical protein